MKQGLFLIFAFCAISNAYAQMDCESIPSCAELGYTQDSCPEGSASLKCPFDETKFYCIGGKKLADAPAPVITPEDWTAECADKVDHCITLDSSCRCTACESGYLVTNGNCVAECAKSVAICAKESKIFNATACACESCPTNYLFVDGECKKMCTVVANCTTYDSDYDPCTCTACKDGYMLENGACVADPCVEKCKVAYPLFAGQENTKAAIDQIGNEALAAYAASQFYVGDKDGDFGQGKWYLPSIGEWMYFYGTDVTQMTKGNCTSGATGENKILINNALDTLTNKGIEAESCLYDMWHWSSSESTPTVWILNGNTGYLYYYSKNSTLPLRFSLLLKNIFNPSAGGTAPKIGDVMYLDKTYGAATDYDGSKTPVGVISSVSPTGRDVTIMNLKYPIFKGFSYAGNFDPENPYGGGQSDRTFWSIENTDISGIPNISSDQLLELAKASDNCPCHFYKPSCSLSADTCAAESKAFNSDTCACEDCPTGQKFNATTKTCEEAACDSVADCAEYDEYCNCVTCEDGYILVEPSMPGLECVYYPERCASYCAEECGGLKRVLGDDGEALSDDYADYEDIFDTDWCFQVAYNRNIELNASEYIEYYTCDFVPCNDSCYRCSTGDRRVYDGYEWYTGSERTVIRYADSSWNCNGIYEGTNNCSR